ncbi:MAG: ribonuclease P protein component [Myxococcota bacterium]
MTRGPETPGAATYRPTDRVRARASYRRVQRQGVKVHTRSFIIMVHVSEAPTGSARLGVTVTRKVGNAVRRNRIKRVVREVFRRNRALFPPADIVFVAKRGLDADLDYASVHAEVNAARKALQRAGRKAAEAASARAAHAASR